MLYFDIVQLGQINDQFGYAEGDRALASFAQLLKQTFQDSDVLARVGDDEFTVLLGNTAIEELNHAQHRLRVTVDQYNRTARHDYNILYYVSAVQFDAARHASTEELLAEAAALMIEQKKTNSDEDNANKFPLIHEQATGQARQCAHHLCRLAITGIPEHDVAGRSGQTSWPDVHCLH